MQRLATVLAQRAGVVLAGLAVLLATPASGQRFNPVYPDDAPLAEQTLAAMDELIAQGSENELVRQLVALLENSGGRVVPAADDPNLFRSVRDTVNDALLARPGLLDRYRASVGPVAGVALAEAQSLVELREIERTALLTEAGYEATLRAAQLLLEDARFEAARLALVQLERHPDRDAGAASLVLEVARVLDRPELWELAERWTSEAGIPAQRRSAIDWPVGALERQVTPTSAMGPIDLSEMIGKPLHSVVLGDPADAVAAAREAGVRGDEDFGSWIFPTVVGDEVYVNDGRFVGRWDRFTLSERWRVRPRATRTGGATGITNRNDRRRFASQTVRPLQTVAVSDDRVVALTTQGTDRRTRVSWVHGLDRQTGDAVWSWRPALDEGADAPEPMGSTPIFENTVIVAAERQIQAQRVWSSFLYGLDARTGAVRWRRPIGSAGSLPYLPRANRDTMSIVDRGVVFRSDRLGLMSAVEVETGRVAWVRRRPALPINSVPQVEQFGVPRPIVVGASVLMQTADGTTIMQLDRATGVLVDELDARRFGTPAYLVPVESDDFGSRLASVGMARITIVDPADLAGDGFITSELIDLELAVGRVVSAGPLVLVPQEAGLTAFHTQGPKRTWQVPLESSGNVIAMPGQLLVAQPGGLHSYLVWDVAQRVLRERMRVEPTSPDPALTFAELAWQAGQYAEIIEGIDRAIAAMPDGQGGDRFAEARAKLLDLLFAMIAQGHSGKAEPGVGLDLARTGQLVDRLASVARSAPERVAALLARGTQAELEGDDTAALAAFQAVLADRELSQSLWGAVGLSMRAESEARRRVLELVERVGPESYAVFEQRAARAIEAAGSNVDEIESAAVRFPAAQASAGGWLAVAIAQNTDGRVGESMRSLEQGLETALVAGGPSDVRRELAGRLVGAQIDRGQIGPAASTLARVPDQTLLDGASEIDREALQMQLDEALAQRERLASIGTTLGPVVTRDQRRVAVPMLPADRLGAGLPDRGRVLLEGSGLGGVVAISMAAWTDLDRLIDQWSWQAGGQNGGRNGGQGSPPVSVIVHSDRLVVLHTRENGDGVLIGLDAADGQELWRVAGVGGGSSERLSVPLEGEVRAGDLVVAADAGVLIASERRGVTVAIDLASGRELWRRDGLIGRVHDVAAGGGVVVLGGAAERGPPGAPTSVLADELVALDLLDGAVLSRREFDPGVQDSAGVRWVRVDDAGTMVAGLDRAVISTSQAQGRSNWVWSASEAEHTLDGWVRGDSIVLMDAGRQAWLGSGTTGRFQPLAEVAQMIGVSGGPAALEDVGTDGAGRPMVRVLGDRGVAIIDAAGRIVAGGWVGQEADRAHAASAEGLSVLVSKRPTVSGELRIWLLDPTGRIVGDPVRVRVERNFEVGSLTVIDGAIVLSGRVGERARTMAIAARAAQDG